MFFNHSLQFIFNNSNYIVSMSESAYKSQMNRDSVADNETLFDFLKRKKKYNLENTVNKTLFQHTNTKKKFDLGDEENSYQKDERTKATNYMSNNQTKRNNRQTVTPKKIQFEDSKKNKSALKQAPQVNNGASQGKSFLSMISPLKKPVVAAVEDNSDNKQNIPRSNKRTSKANESFSKKNVTKCINTIKQAMNSLSITVRSLKEKSHGLVIQFNPFFNHIAESNTAISKQVGDFRNKLKGFQTLIDAANAQNTDEVVESFHKTLEEHLQIEEGQLRKALQKTKEEEIAHIRNEKDRLIDRLQTENKKLSKEVGVLQRRLEKAESHHQNLEEAVTDREMTNVQQLERLKTTYQAKIEQLQSQNEELIQRYQSLTQKNKNYERQLKNQRFSKEDFEEKRRSQVQHIIEAKDAYLLNEIMVLKTEFNSDLNRINQLHKIKEAELLSRIEKKGEQVSKLSFERGCDKQIQSKILQEANYIKQENAQLKSKVQCIITDMYRMNEELYQHWIALKDIKALSHRLGSFAQYRKIYQDLLFNDHLFH